MTELTPRQIVEELDKHIVGQREAKRAIAVAIRNRWRRQRVDESMRDEIGPKNVMMIGPTGVGKTEVARRLAALTGAPFIKVDATKYTEVGYHGSDVESMVRELVENALGIVREEERRANHDKATQLAQTRLLTALVLKFSQSNQTLEEYKDDSEEQKVKEHKLTSEELDLYLKTRASKTPSPRISISSKKRSEANKVEASTKPGLDPSLPFPFPSQEAMESARKSILDDPNSPPWMKEFVGSLGSLVQSADASKAASEESKTSESESQVAKSESLKKDEEDKGKRLEEAEQRETEARQGFYRLYLRTKKALESESLEEELLDVNGRRGRRPQVEFLFADPREMDSSFDLDALLRSKFGDRHAERRVNVAEARKFFYEEELDKLLDDEKITSRAVALAQDMGVIFIDEIDKIVGTESSHADVSRQGVQRDLLPIVEGTTVRTRYGHVSTNHVLFIAAGAFHKVKPSDLTPELQGRFPIRVELSDLTKADFVRILTEPENSLTKQYTALMKTENIDLVFEESAIEAIAEYAEQANQTTQNIGARRLYTIMERLLEDLNFEAASMTIGRVVINGAYVEEKIGKIVKDEDLSKFIL
ncbi:MAG: ATP-dependent protease ATPase subunit HslU [Thermoguttaceae bacterium]